MKKGSIYTIAGCGKAGFKGDGGDAKLAMLNEPKGMTIDSQGNIYIADSENCLVRLVNSKGVISAIAGSASEKKDEKEDAYDLKFQLELAEIPRREGLDAGLIGDEKAATSAKLKFPSGVAQDKEGNIYIADTYNHRVRKVDFKSGIITTIAGNGKDGFSGDGGPATEASLSEPSGILLDQESNIYVSDLRNNRIRKIDKAKGIIMTVAGNGEISFEGDNGPAIQASLANPSSMAMNKEGNIYIADTFNDRIRLLDVKTGLISTAAGDNGRYKIGQQETSEKYLSRPYLIALDSAENIYVTDSDNHLIRKIDSQTGEITNIAGNGEIGCSPDGAPANEASLNYPSGIAIDSKDNLYIADTFNHRIRKVQNN